MQIETKRNIQLTTFRFGKVSLAETIALRLARSLSSARSALAGREASQEETGARQRARCGAVGWPERATQRNASANNWLSERRVERDGEGRAAKRRSNFLSAFGAGNRIDALGCESVIRKFN